MIGARFRYLTSLAWIVCFFNCFVDASVAQTTKVLIQDIGYTELSNDIGMVVSHDKQFILTYDAGGNHGFWDLKSGRLLKSIRSELGGKKLFSYAEWRGSSNIPKLSQDGKYMVSKSLIDGELCFVVWDIQKEKIIKVFNGDHEGDKVVFSFVSFLPNGMLLTHGVNRKLNLYQLAVYNLEQSQWKEIFIDRSVSPNAPDGKSIATVAAVSSSFDYFGCGTSDGKILIFNASKMTMNQSKGMFPEKVLKLGNAKITHLRFSKDNQLILGVDPKELKIFSLKTGLQTNSSTLGFTYPKDQEDTDSWISKNQVTESGSYMISLVASTKTLRTLDPFTGNLVRTVTLKDEVFEVVSYLSESQVFSYDGELAFDHNPNNNVITVVNLAKSQVLPSLILSDLYAVTSVIFNDVRNELYIGKMRNDALIFELNTGRIKSLKRFIYHGDTLQYPGNTTDKIDPDYYKYDNFLLSKDGNKLFSFDGLASRVSRTGILWDLNTKQPIDWWFDLSNYDSGMDVLHSVDTTKKYHSLFEDRKYEGVNISKEEKGKDWRNWYKVSFVSPQTNKKITFNPFATWTTETVYQNYIIGAGFSNDKSKLFLVVNEGTMLIHDTRTGKLLQSIFTRASKQVIGHINFIRFSKDRRFLYLSERGKQPKVIEIDLLNGMAKRELAFHDRAINEMAFIANETILVTTGKDKRVKFWDLASARLLMTMVVNDKEYLLFTPDGYYMASKNGIALIHYVQENKVYLAQQFDLKFNRPDIILGLLGTVPEDVLRSYQSAYQKRLTSEQLSQTSFAENKVNSVPTITLTKSKEIDNFGRLEINIKGSDQSKILSKIRIWVNGVPEIGFNPLDLSKNAARSMQRQVTIQLASGRNIVECAVVNQNGVESLHEIIEVFYERKVENKTLYLLAIGVGKYKDLDPLNLAAKDVRDFYHIVRNQQTIFDKVVIDTLIDEHATQKNFLDICAKYKAIKPDDHLYIFYAGHGLRDVSKNYYLATYDASKTNFTSSISMELIQNVLRSSRSRNKLVLLDACFSGKQDLNSVLDKANQQANGINSFELMQDVFTDLSNNVHGATIIAATRGDSYAMESTSIKNGFFTSGLLKALMTLFADSNGDKQISVRELQEFLEYEVSRISYGLQVPVSRAENQLNNFRVW